MKRSGSFKSKSDAIRRDCQQARSLVFPSAIGLQLAYQLHALSVALRSQLANIFPRRKIHVVNLPFRVSKQPLFGVNFPADTKFALESTLLLSHTSETGKTVK